MENYYAKGIKQGTQRSLTVSFDDGENELPLDDVERIEFIFKQKRSRNAETIKSAVWEPSDENGVVRIADTNSLSVLFTKEETYGFEPGKPFYMDTRIYTEYSEENPATAIVELMMNDTLFDREAEN